MRGPVWRESASARHVQCSGKGSRQPGLGLGMGRGTAHCCAARHRFVFSPGCASPCRAAGGTRAERPTPPWVGVAGLLPTTKPFLRSTAARAPDRPPVLSGIDDR